MTTVIGGGVRRLVAKWNILAKFYQPEKYYMRGPGPKCRQRGSSHVASSRRVL
jgi:hypothetical protein